MVIGQNKLASLPFYPLTLTPSDKVCSQIRIHGTYEYLSAEATNVINQLILILPIYHPQFQDFFDVSVIFFKASVLD